MVLLSFLLSVGAVWQLRRLPERTKQVIQFTWIAGLPFHMANGQLATFTVDWGFLLDPLSSVMILVVTGIGFLIHVYATGYMDHDNGYYRFFGVPEPVRVLHADAGAGQQLRAAVRRLGRRRVCAATC